MLNPTEPENDVLSDGDLNAEAEPAGNPPDGNQPGEGGAAPEGGDPKPESQPKPAPEGAAGGPPSQVPYHVFAERNARLRAAEAELARLRGGQQPQAPQQPVDNDPRPKQEDFQDFNEFIRAEARWEGRNAGREAYKQERQKDEQNRSAQDAATQQQQAVKSWFDKTANEDAAFHEAAQDLHLGGLLWHQLMRAENPVAIAKHLINNQAEVRRLSMLPATEQLVAFGELRAKLTGANAGPQKKPGSKVPNLNPVGQGNRANGRDIYKDDVSDDEFTRGLFPLPG